MEEIRKMKNKKIYAIIIVFAVICLLAVVALCIVNIRKNSENEESITEVTETTENELAEEANNTILLDQTNYHSLYGTGIMILPDDEFDQAKSSCFYGDTEASEDAVVEEIVRLRNFIRNGQGLEAFNSMIAFGKKYSLPNNDSSKELGLLSYALPIVKDLSELSDNGWTDEAVDTICNISDVETFLQCAVQSKEFYKFCLDDRSITLSGTFAIAGDADILPEGNELYQLAATYLPGTNTIYRYPVPYDDDTNLYVYVVSNDNGSNHILTVSNTDGSYLSPSEKESGSEYDNLPTFEHPEGWDNGAGEKETTESPGTDSTETTTIPSDSETTEENLQ